MTVKTLPDGNGVDEIGKKNAQFVKKKPNDFLNRANANTRIGHELHILLPIDISLLLMNIPHTENQPASSDPMPRQN